MIWIAAALVAAGALLLARHLAMRPRAEADWVPNEARLAWAEFEGARVTVHEVRNTVYRSDEDYDPVWETRSFDLGRLRRGWFVVVPFPDMALGAHTFVSFEFEDDRFLAVSIEARKERGERYGVLAGLLRRFEVIYVVADERDLIGLRSHVRGDEVYLYPVRAEPEDLRAFLVELLRGAGELRERPEFYNVLTNNCTTRLVRHLNDVRTSPLRWSLGVLFPALSDRFALREGLLDTDLPLEEARRRHRVDPQIVSRTAPDFSEAIRAGSLGTA